MLRGDTPVILALVRTLAGPLTNLRIKDSSGSHLWAARQYTISNTQARLAGRSNNWKGLRNSMRKLLTLISGLTLALSLAWGAEDPTADHVKWMKDLSTQMGAIRKSADVA